MGIFETEFFLYYETILCYKEMWRCIDNVVVDGVWWHGLFASAQTYTNTPNPELAHRQKGKRIKSTKRANISER